MPRGIKIRETRVGDGDVASGDSITTIHYEGTLRRGDLLGDGTETIDLRRRETIAGLRCGIEGMRVGGRRRITVGVIRPTIATATISQRTLSRGQGRHTGGSKVQGVLDHNAAGYHPQFVSPRCSATPLGH
jgi:FKBP-type peptidyl-prolyl cis-trans isomerase